MEVSDWNANGKQSFTTPGGQFQYPTEKSKKVYSFDRAERRVDAALPRPEPRTGAPSPFSREAFSASQSAGSSVELAGSGAAIITGHVEAAGTPLITSHDGEASAAPPAQSASSGYTVLAQMPGGYIVTPPNTESQIITIQLPPAQIPAPQKPSARWSSPLVWIAALLLGLLVGLLLSPLLRSESAATETGEAIVSEGSFAAAVYQHNADTVVGITAIPSADFAQGAYMTASTGSGFILSTDGYLLTNAHVLEHATKLQVRLRDGRQFDARVVNTELNTSDLALLKIEAEGLHAVTIGDSDTLHVGDPVCTIGNPVGELDYSLTTGYLSSGPRQLSIGDRTLTMLQTNAAINKGNSGGPLFDAKGRVIGLVSGKLSVNDSSDTSLEGLGFALPINAVMALADPWIAADRGE